MCKQIDILYEAIGDATEIDINQWHGMLLGGNWDEVVHQMVQEPLEENATTDTTRPLLKREDWEVALRKWFTYSEVDMS